MLPDGVTEVMLDNLDLDEWKDIPEKAIILADFAIKHQTVRRRDAWLKIMCIIHYVDKHNLWQHHPESYNSINEWCMQPEIDLHASDISDMLFIGDWAERLLEDGINLYELIRVAGHSKLRKLVPQMRETVRPYKLDTPEEAEVAQQAMVQQMGPLFDDLPAATSNEIQNMLNPQGVRLIFDPVAQYEECDDGSYNVTFTGLNFDTLELISKKLRLRKWKDEQGRPIPSPVALPGSI